MSKVSLKASLLGENALGTSMGDPTATSTASVYEHPSTNPVTSKVVVSYGLRVASWLSTIWANSSGVHTKPSVGSDPLTSTFTVSP